jgi:hypothetical protein
MRELEIRSARRLAYPAGKGNAAILPCKAATSASSGGSPPTAAGLAQTCLVGPRLFTPASARGLGVLLPGRGIVGWAALNRRAGAGLTVDRVRLPGMRRRGFEREKPQTQRTGLRDLALRSLKSDPVVGSPTRLTRA